jgi:hypothetical protein
MLTSEITCPYCNFTFAAAIWVDGSCEKCGGNYYWSMESNQDTTDAWHVVEWDQKKSLYIATTLSNWKRAANFIHFFSGVGVPIAFDWTPWGREIFEAKTKRDINPTSLCKKAINEYEGVSSASYVLVIVPTGLGTNFELGVAYQRYKISGSPIITILDETEPTAPVSFHYLEGIERTNSIRDVVDDILAHFNIDSEILTKTDFGMHSCFSPPTIKDNNGTGDENEIPQTS